MERLRLNAVGGTTQLPLVKGYRVFSIVAASGKSSSATAYRPARRMTSNPGGPLVSTEFRTSSVTLRVDSRVLNVFCHISAATLQSAVSPRPTQQHGLDSFYAKPTTQYNSR